MAVYSVCSFNEKWIMRIAFMHWVSRILGAPINIRNKKKYTVSKTYAISIYMLVPAINFVPKGAISIFWLPNSYWGTKILNT